MPTASGFVQVDNNQLVGTFELDDGPRYLSVNIKRHNLSFECSDATLMYNTVEQIFGPCVWSGTCSRTTIQLKQVGGGVTITGKLDTRRAASGLVNGAGMWGTGEPHSLDQPARDDAVGPGPREDTLETALDRAAKLEREKKLLSSGAPIIAIFGQSGVGKSTFINLVATEKQKVGKGLQSCTDEINIVEATIRGRPVVVIDTPGIDSSLLGLTEADVLVHIAGRLAYMGMDNVWVTGVLILHRISNNILSPTANLVSNMLKNLCGNDAMTHLALCTTMWDKVEQEDGFERLNKLRNTGAWKEMINKGASTVRIANLSPDAKENAENIVNDLIENRTVKLRIQKQIIDEGKSVLECDAGQVLENYFRELRDEPKRKMTEEREAMREEMNACATKAQKTMDAQRLEIESLKKQAEQQSRDHQALSMRLQQEKEKSEREITELRKAQRRGEQKADEATSKLAEERRAADEREQALRTSLSGIEKRLQVAKNDAEREHVAAGEREHTLETSLSSIKKRLQAAKADAAKERIAVEAALNTSYGMASHLLQAVKDKTAKELRRCEERAAEAISKLAEELRVAHEREGASNAALIETQRQCKELKANRAGGRAFDNIEGIDGQAVTSLFDGFIDAVNDFAFLVINELDEEVQTASIALDRVRGLATGNQWGGRILSSFPVSTPQAQATFECIALPIMQSMTFSLLVERVFIPTSLASDVLQGASHHLDILRDRVSAREPQTRYGRWRAITYNAIRSTTDNDETLARNISAEIRQNISDVLEALLPPSANLDDTLRQCVNAECRERAMKIAFDAIKLQDTMQGVCVSHDYAVFFPTPGDSYSASDMEMSDIGPQLMEEVATAAQHTGGRGTVLLPVVPGLRAMRIESDLSRVDIVVKKASVVALL